MGIRKGIVLAGGADSRFYPNGAGVRQAADALSADHADAGGSREIMIISIDEDLPRFPQLQVSCAGFAALRRDRIRHRPQALSIEEKPRMLKSHYAVTGPYFHDGSVRDIAAGLRPSHAASSNITGINQAYLSAGRWPESRGA